jgi:maltose-binding protein MalE
MVNDAIDKKISWQNDTFLNALKVIQYVSIEASAPDAPTAAQDYASELSRFAAKKYWGKWYAGEWEIGDYTKLAPDDIKAGEYGIANGPTPTANANPNIHIGGPGQTYSVNAKSANADIAIDFLKFLSSEDAVKIMLKHDIHPAGKVASPEQYTNNLLLKEFLKQTTVEGFKTVPFSMKSAEVEQQMINNFGKMYLKQMTPEQFLQDMDKTFQNK